MEHQMSEHTEPGAKTLGEILRGYQFPNYDSESRIPVSVLLKCAADADALIEQRDRLLAAVKQWASECAECDGSSEAPHYADRSTEQGRAEPMFKDCKDCTDIRALIKTTNGAELNTVVDTPKNNLNEAFDIATREWAETAQERDAIKEQRDRMREALSKLPDAEATSEALADAVRFYGSTAVLTSNAEELKKALIFRNVLGLLYASLIDIRALVASSGERGK